MMGDEINQDYRNIYLEVRNLPLSVRTDVLQALRFTMLNHSDVGYRRKLRRHEIMASNLSAAGKHHLLNEMNKDPHFMPHFMEDDDDEGVCKSL